MNISRINPAIVNYQPLNYTVRKVQHHHQAPTPLGDITNVAKDIEKGIGNTSNDLIHKNISGTTKDIGQGIYNTSKDTIKGIGHFIKSVF